MNSLTILVVEDNKASLKLTTVSLKGMGFKEILTAEDGQKGLTFARENKPDIILADWDMPIMTGIEMLVEIRNDPALNKTPFVMQTSKRSQKHIMEAIQKGVDSYIIKPYESNVLITKISEVLQKYQKI